YITLGGVKIPHNQAFLAHSDGDVLIHALVDALAGSLALGDIGQFFPDNDPQYENIDSRILLRQVYEVITEKKYRLVNCDCTIVAQNPKMSPHINTMRENLASDLKSSKGQISVKATTTEKLGFAGKEQGIAVYAVVLVEKI
ncbi:UNVERIFIED_CONTAM: hypothetical protein GTU68_021710, partial [Idotea baltica]|nr:hypothetical protein [Idotea baltica]